MIDEGRYWVLGFLEENNLTSLKQVEAFLPQYGVLKTLQRRAADVLSGNESNSHKRTRSIVAGSGVDLTGGGVVCPSPSCMRRQVDELFKHIWHYFDTVVVNDVLTPLLVEEWEGTKKDLFAEITKQLSPLLYLLEIGGAEFVEFLPKPQWCYEHPEQHAMDAGLGDILAAKPRLITRMMNDARFSFRAKGKQRMVCIELDEVTVSRPVGKLADGEAKLALADSVFNDHLVELTSDVAASRQYGLPLGLVQSLAGRMLQSSQPPSASEVAFHLELPVLAGISTADLIRIRRDYSEYFASFRDALASATRDRLSTSETNSSAAIADEIRADVIEPELDKIRTSLKSAERSLATKATVGIFLGVLTTTCGLLLGVAPNVAGSAGIATSIGVTSAAASRHLDELREASLNDMYFLWKAIGHAH